MKTLTMFYLEDCGYCQKAFRALEELYEEEPSYRNVQIAKIEESQNAALAEQYDYYAVPTFFAGQQKLFEAHLFMSYEDIKEEVRRVLRFAVEE